MRWTRLALLALLPLELFGFAWDERRQADRSLYFPPVPILERLAALPQGRIWGVGCLTPNLNLICGLEDVRGYDAVDPLNYLKLFQLACDKESSVQYPECRTVMAEPAGKFDEHGLRLHPVADLLNVRYLVFAIHLGAVCRFYCMRTIIGSSKTRTSSRAPTCPHQHKSSTAMKRSSSRWSVSTSTHARRF